MRQDNPRTHTSETRLIPIQGCAGKSQETRITPKQRWENTTSTHDVLQHKLADIRNLANTMDCIPRHRTTYDTLAHITTCTTDIRNYIQ
jgi:hypothetical protein